jgi:hypothetical protein
MLKNKLDAQTHVLKTQPLLQDRDMINSILKRCYQRCLTEQYDSIWDHVRVVAHCAQKWKDVDLWGQCVKVCGGFKDLSILDIGVFLEGWDHYGFSAIQTVSVIVHSSHHHQLYLTCCLFSLEGSLLGDQSNDRRLQFLTHLLQKAQQTKDTTAISWCHVQREHALKTLRPITESEVEAIFQSCTLDELTKM